MKVGAIAKKVRRWGGGGGEKTLLDISWFGLFVD